MFCSKKAEIFKNNFNFLLLLLYKTRAVNVAVVFHYIALTKNNKKDLSQSTFVYMLIL